MNERIVLDTTITEPPADAGEAEMLQFLLDRSRATFAWKVADLDAEALRRPFPPSAMTLAGLIKHLTGAEERKMAWTITGEPPAPPWDEIDPDADPDWEWRTALDDSPEELYANWVATVTRSRAAVAGLLATGGGLDARAKLSSDDFPVNARRMLADLHDEYARHVGHADLFREAIDGRVGEDPPQWGR